jgi:hypothetical protein
MLTKLQFLAVSFLILFLASGCATYQHKSVEARGVDTYTCVGKAAGITVAADAYDTSEKAKEGFYVDVTEKGFYPVNLIFVNECNDRILVTRDSITLTDGQQNLYRPVRSVIMSDIFEHNKMAYALLGFGIFSYMSAEEANKKMAADWKDKEMADQLIIPEGRKMNGFVYFRLPEGKKVTGSKLNVEVEKLGTKEKVLLEVML